MAGRKYKNPPIVEALCEIQFKPQGEWNSNVPSLVHKGFLKEFPKSRKAKRLNIGVMASPQGMRQEVKEIDLTQFLKGDEKTLIQVGMNLLSINRLAPYTTWHELFPLIKKALKEYQKAANPLGIQTVGVRYINKCEIPAAVVELEDYLNFYPELNGPMRRIHGPFFVGVQIPYPDSNGIMKMELISTTPSQPERIAFLLDFDYIIINSASISLDNIANWIDTAHSHIEDSFEDCIKEPLRALFEESRE